MPKMKSKSSAKKRFTATAKGRIKVKRAKRAHILTTKTTKTKRHLRRGAVLKKMDEVLVKRMLPYL
jgi:large subunit ribosomal protein L35